MNKVYVLTGYYPGEQTKLRVLGVFKEDLEGVNMLNELMNAYIEKSIKEDHSIDVKVRQDGCQVTIHQASHIGMRKFIKVQYELHDRSIL